MKVREKERREIINTKKSVFAKNEVIPGRAVVFRARKGPHSKCRQDPETEHLFYPELLVDLGRKCPFVQHLDLYSVITRMKFQLFSRLSDRLLTYRNFHFRPHGHELLTQHFGHCSECMLCRRIDIEGRQ